MEKIQITAKSYDEAVDQAIIKLGTTSDKLVIEVISEGSTGLLGLFKKPWVVNFSKKDTEKLEDNDKKNIKVNNIEENDINKENELENKKYESKEISEEKISEISNKALDFLRKMFSTVGIEIDVEYSYDSTDNSLNILINSEEDMGIIIGKRGQTLDSLQYLLSLVLNKNTEDYIRIKLDTGDYREKRREKIKILAKNMAAKAKSTKRAVKLEPMNPYERRIIHSVLQNDYSVKTKSEGEEPFRYVVIIPKMGYNRNRKSNS